MDDLISRTAALDALDRLEYTPGEWATNGLTMCKDAIKALPSAQQWIPRDSGKFSGESGYYTVTAYDGTTKRVTHAKYQKRLKRWELTGARAYWRVLAWLPPLEPWEGDTP